MESYYDSIPEFQYWDISSWKSYLEDIVQPIYKSTQVMLKLKSKIAQYVEKSLKFVKTSEDKLLPFFVGGIDKDGNYKERSLAKLIKLMFGVYIDPKRFVDIVSILGEEGLKDVKVNKVESTAFLKLVQYLNKFSSEILRNAGIKTEVSKVDEIVQDPNKLLDILKEFYKACIHFSSNHNYYTFFVVSTASIHWKYLVTAYPKLENHFEKVREFLGLEPIFVPEIGNDEIKRDYTIWGHKRGGLADNLYRMQVCLWQSFNFSENVCYLWDAIYPQQIKEIFSYVVPEVEDIKREYSAIVEECLPADTPKSVIDWGKVGLEGLGTHEVEYYLKVEGVIITEYWNTYSPTYWKHIHRRTSCPLTDFLDTAGPRLFLGLARIFPSDYPNVLVYVDHNLKHPARWLK